MRRVIVGDASLLESAEFSRGACDEGESFWVARLPVDFSVTKLEGKAPYTIELKSSKLDGEGWKWDFGDGATGSGPVGRHTYAKPGQYVAAARKDKSVFRQGVTVLPRKAPLATGLSALDPRHVLVEFDEPVQSEKAAVSPKRPVPGLQVAYYVGGDLGALPGAGPHHIVVAMAPKRLTLYVDGAKVREVDPSPAKFLLMAPPLKFGGEHANGDLWQWKGRMEGIAMYGRFVEEAEAERSWNAYRAKLAARKPMDRVVVDALLTAKTAAPEPKDMMPYRSALVVYEYAVQKVRDGKAIRSGQVLRVAHWGVYDLKKTPAAKRAVGTTVPLTLERFTDHPELDGQFMRDDLPFSEAELWTDGQP